MLGRLTLWTFLLAFCAKSFLLPYGYEKLLLFFTLDVVMVEIFYDFALSILPVLGPCIEFKFGFATLSAAADVPILELVYSLEKLVAFDGLIDMVDVFIPVFTML